ncbi:MAG: hypothetical protein Q8R28_01200 [Dehalococcoidia bacterium]|nr:hypothetical protein [Dehalococcoidia bacterium]
MRLAVVLNSRIQFYSSSDLPADFRRQIAEENTVPNHPPAVKRGAPERVELFTHNPFTREVALPRSYWPRLLELAMRHGIDVEVRDLRRDNQKPVLSQPMAIDLEHWHWAFESLGQLLAPRLPADWRQVHIQVTVTHWEPGPKEFRPADLGHALEEVVPGGQSATPQPDPGAPRRHYLRGGSLSKVPLPGGADLPGGGA